MTRLAAVLAALAVAGCGGSDSGTDAQAYRYQIPICQSEGSCTQLGRCVNLLKGAPGAAPAYEAYYCRQLPQYPAPTWSRTASDPQHCAPADCQEVDVAPPAPTCQAVIECSRPF